MSFGKIDAASMPLDTTVIFGGGSGGTMRFSQLFALLKFMPDGTAVTITSQKQFENADSLDDYYVAATTQIVRDTANGRDDLAEGAILFHPQIQVSENRLFQASFTRDSSYIDPVTGNPIDLSTSSTAFDFYWEVQEC